MTIAVLLVSHSELADGMKAAVEFVAGPQANFYALGLKEAGIERYRLELKELLLKLEKSIDTVIIISDILAGSPGANAIVSGKESRLNIVFLSGMNLALVLDIILSRESKTLEYLVADGIESARTSVELLELDELVGNGSEEF